MAATPGHTELYTTKTLFTLGGSSGAVWLLTTILSIVFGIDPGQYAWIGLIVAMIISVIGGIQAKKISLQSGTVIFFNGLLIYVTAVGFDSLNQGVRINGNASKAAIIPFTDTKPWYPTISLVDSVKVYKEEIVRTEQVKNREIDSLKVELMSLLAARDSLISVEPEANPLYTTIKAELGRIYRDLAAYSRSKDNYDWSEATTVVKKMSDSFTEEVLTDSQAQRRWLNHWRTGPFFYDGVGQRTEQILTAWMQMEALMRVVGGQNGINSRF